jgi:DMSO/TMAO reductase YedYZ molybdopterin-dependent catalytic subunit
MGVGGDFPKELTELAPQSEPGSNLARRSVLIGLAVAASSLFIGAPIENLITNSASALGAGSLTSFLPGGGFRYYTVTGGYPLIDKASYRLKVSGLVDTVNSYGFDELSKLNQVELIDDFQCVTGWVVKGVRWKGVALADLIEMAHPSKGAQAVNFYSADNVYSESLSLSQVKQLGVLVAISMDNKPLSQAHGGPVRLFVPKMFGYKSIKWLNEIKVSSSQVVGYWEQNGYPQDAYIANYQGL